MRDDKPLPSNWRQAPLGEIAQKFLNGGTPSTEISEFWEGNIPWITGADIEDQKVIYGRRHITPEAVKKSSTNVVPQGHLMICTRTGVGKVAYALIDTAISQDFTGMIVDTANNDVQFLFWQLNRLSQQLARLKQGTSIKGLLREDVEKFSVPVPPLVEQKKITLILNSVNGAIEATQAVIDQTVRLKFALLQDLFSNGLPGKHSNFRKYKRFGRIPAEWDIQPLGKLCISATDGPFGSNLKTSHYSKDGVRVIRLQNIYPAEFDETDKAYIPEAHFDGLRKYEVKAGDMVIASMGDENNFVGRSCLVPPFIIPAMIKADCFRFRADSKKTVNAFLMWYMNSSLAQPHIARSSHGQTRLRLNLANAMRIPVPVPCLDEQRQIVSLISSAHEKQKKEQLIAISLMNLKIALSQGLLSGQIRVTV